MSHFAAVARRPTEDAHSPAPSHGHHSDDSEDDRGDPLPQYDDNEYDELMQREQVSARRHSGHRDRSQSRVASPYPVRSPTVPDEDKPLLVDAPSRRSRSRHSGSPDRGRSRSRSHPSDERERHQSHHEQDSRHGGRGRDQVRSGSHSRWGIHSEHDASGLLRPPPPHSNRSSALLPDEMQPVVFHNQEIDRAPADSLWSRPGRNRERDALDDLPHPEEERRQHHQSDHSAGIAEWLGEGQPTRTPRDVEAARRPRHDQAESEKGKLKPWQRWGLGAIVVIAACGIGGIVWGGVQKKTS